MFALFFSLYVSMFNGTWNLYTIPQIAGYFREVMNALGKLLTSMFNNVSTPYATLGSDLENYFIMITGFILALITCIGIVVMAVKGIKRIFSVFFYGVR